MDAGLTCMYSRRDTLRVIRDDPGTIKFRSEDSDGYVSVFVSDSDAREFARKILELTGDEASDEPVKIGDRVEITKYRNHDSSDVGKRGVIKQIDSDDRPYFVELDEGGHSWAMEVRKIAPDSPASRAAQLEEARRVAGAGATPADVLSYAKYLAGE